MRVQLLIKMPLKITLQTSRSLIKIWQFLIKMLRLITKIGLVGIFQTKTGHSPLNMKILVFLRRIRVKAKNLQNIHKVNPSIVNKNNKNHFILLRSNQRVVTLKKKRDLLRTRSLTKGNQYKLLMYLLNRCK